MRKSALGALITALLLCIAGLDSFPAQASNTIKAGSVCSQNHAPVVQNFAIFTCTKVAKKYVWSSKLIYGNPILLPDMVEADLVNQSISVSINWPGFDSQGLIFPSTFQIGVFVDNQAIPTQVVQAGAAIPSFTLSNDSHSIYLKYVFQGKSFVSDSVQIQQIQIATSAPSNNSPLTVLANPYITGVQGIVPPSPGQVLTCTGWVLSSPADKIGATWFSYPASLAGKPFDVTKATQLAISDASSGYANLTLNSVMAKALSGNSLYCNVSAVAGQNTATSSASIAFAPVVPLTPGIVSPIQGNASSNSPSGSFTCSTIGASPDATLTHTWSYSIAGITPLQNNVIGTGSTLTRSPALIPILSHKILTCTVTATNWQGTQSASNSLYMNFLP